MKKILSLLLITLFVSAAPALARTKYDKYGHKITPVKKKPQVQAAAKTYDVQKMTADETQAAPQVEEKKEKVKVKQIGDKRGRNMGTAVRNGDGNDFTMYNARGQKMGSYVEDEDGKNGKFYDVRGREITRVRRTTQDLK